MNDSMNEIDEDFALINETDKAIIMHRDSHFGGSFEQMLQYYSEDGKGVQQEFEYEQIAALNAAELKLKQNLAGVLLSGPEAEKVADAKSAYKKLRDLYEDKTAAKSEQSNLKLKYPLLIADLILSEEEFPQKEIDAIVAEKGAIVSSLLTLLRAEDYHDPLFPGYGLAPGLAAKCLGLIGDKRAIISLFEMIGESDFFDEDIIIEALKLIGEPAKQFLLKVVHAHPFNQDNERAAVALTKFSTDQDVASECFKLLKELDLKRQELLATHLVLCCEGLNTAEQRAAFVDLAEDQKTPKTIRQDMRIIAKTW